ncbi:MAG: hypothetical protein Q7R54_03355 [bacterium]|nr:hypothetical protein [bacterium]
MDTRVQHGIKNKIIPAECGADHPERVAVENFRHIHFGRYEESVGRERDIFDDSSTYIVISENDTIAAVCRLIHRPPEIMLPIQIRGDLEETLPYTAEVSRIGFKHRVSEPEIVRDALYRAIFEELSRLEYEQAYASVQPYYLRTLQDLFGRTVMMQVGDLATRVKAGKETKYVPMGINVSAWSEYFKKWDG